MPNQVPSNKLVLDRHVRTSLHKYLATQNYGTYYRVVDELPFYADKEEGRADVVVVTDKLHCFEIKSEADSLDRLKRQVRIYTKVMDTLSVVTTMKHAGDAKRMLPKHWGIYLYNEKGLVVKERGADQHAGVKVRSLAGMLWKQQAFDLLSSAGAERGFAKKAKDVLHDHIVVVCSPEEIREAVCRQYKQHYITPRRQLERQLHGT